MPLGIVFGLLATLPLAVLLLALRAQRRPKALEVAVGGLCSLVLIAAAWAAVDRDAAVEADEPQRPIEVTGNGYVSSRECGACHALSHATWQASYHRTMTQVASPTSVVAPFDGVELRGADESISLSRRGDEFFARFDAEHGSEKKIELTTGSHHFQVYWTALDKGRELQIFPYAYQIAEKRWIQTDHLVLADPRRAELESVWNRHCIQCHSTAGRPRLLSGSTTEVGEFGIACEACHGPAERHIGLNRDPQRRYQLHLSGDPDPSIVNPARLSHDRASEICGQCHSVNTFYSKQGTRTWSEQGYPFRPGDVLAESRKVFHSDADYSIAGETAFWPDDMVRVNGREYNSLLKTPCYQRGELSCLSCHRLHKAVDDPRSLTEWADDQLEVGMRENVACLQCHAPFADSERLARHTHHAADGAGSRCYDCHMPHTAYGLHKVTRSHQVTNPSVAVELETSRPNACSLCHLDRPLAWVAERLDAWYGIESPPLPDVHRKIAAGVVWTLSGDAGQRALAAWHMGWGPAQQASGSQWLPPYLAELVVDGYPAIRSLAARSLQRLPGYQDIEAPFEADVADRRAVKRRILERWQATAAPSRRALLIAHGGRLDETLFSELLRRRDRRFVWLLE